MPDASRPVPSLPCCAALVLSSHSFDCEQMPYIARFTVIAIIVSLCTNNTASPLVVIPEIARGLGNLSSSLSLSLFVLSKCISLCKLHVEPFRHSRARVHDMT